MLCAAFSQVGGSATRFHVHWLANKLGRSACRTFSNRLTDVGGLWVMPSTRLLIIYPCNGRGRGWLEPRAAPAAKTAEGSSCKNRDLPTPPVRDALAGSKGRRYTLGKINPIASGPNDDSRRPKHAPSSHDHLDTAPTGVRLRHSSVRSWAHQNSIRRSRMNAR